MKKHPIFSVLCLSLIIVASGISVAYYNTRTMGFDEDTVFFSKDTDGVTFLDHTVYYKDAIEIYNTISNYMPEEAVRLELNIV